MLDIATTAKKCGLSVWRQRNGVGNSEQPRPEAGVTSSTRTITPKVCITTTASVVPVDYTATGRIISLCLWLAVHTPTVCVDAREYMNIYANKVLMHGEDVCSRCSEDEGTERDLAGAPEERDG